jgi:hypothetical protein
MDCQSNEFSHLKYIVAIIHSYHVRTNLPITNNVVSSNPTQTKLTTLCDKKVCQWLLQKVGKFSSDITISIPSNCQDIS